ncbi:PH domain-containing protein [Clostridium cellulovorans]|uniref:DUF304 domain-containing protein n=1 Tax=Clostridium cellulovorans (strain ATCC 35296 / DSM 3052 / OCM 3 / 743B) TaxID=573061 RepID=D9SP71_CLOC7|nr:PH domain-containing protein [Clostridium cellulovorans]ADL52036.1 hypothetical protein Clocel_2314 [Clostridium cellulovorans 743B]
MRFKNKGYLLILLFFAIIGMYSIAYFDNKIERKIFMWSGAIFATIMYIPAAFEYYEVTEEGLTYRNVFGYRNNTLLWKDIRKIEISTYQVAKIMNFKWVEIKGGINHGTININRGVKDYKKLIKIILEKTKDNPRVIVDSTIYDFIK